MHPSAAALFHWKDESAYFIREPSHDPYKVEVARPLSSDTKLEQDMKYPELTPWLSKLERRLKNSTLPPGTPAGESREYLSFEVSNAALCLFRNAADLLAFEPYIYASKTGNLVAEFPGKDRPPLTILVSKDSVILFAATESEPREKILRGAETDRSVVRRAISELFE
jgi:hypothetical protein